MRYDMKGAKSDIRACYTLYTDGKAMTENAFGFNTPKESIMFGALSVLETSNHFNEVVLYTDNEGARMMVDTLNLPFTDVHICYNKNQFKINPKWWGLAKMHTISKQDKPFFQLDFDVLMPFGLKEEVLESPLFCQNLETTYKGWAKQCFGDYAQSIKADKCILDNLLSGAPNSYCVGIVGGADLDFIHSWCENAFRIARDNGLYDRDYNAPSVLWNQLVEQISLYAMVQDQYKSMNTIVPTQNLACAYSFDTIFDMPNYHEDNGKIYHALSFIKRCEVVTDFVYKTMCAKYPTYFNKIIELFD